MKLFEVTGKNGEKIIYKLEGELEEKYDNFPKEKGMDEHTWDIIPNHPIILSVLRYTRQISKKEQEENLEELAHLIADGEIVEEKDLDSLEGETLIHIKEIQGRL